MTFFTVMKVYCMMKNSLYYQPNIQCNSEIGSESSVLLN